MRYKSKILSEYALFIMKIKPAIAIYPEHPGIRYLSKLNDVYKYNDHGNLVFSWHKIPSLDTAADFGKALGYYPESCEAFERRLKFGDFKTWQELVLISIEELSFVAEDEWKEAFTWCRDKYINKICSKVRVCKYLIRHQNLTQVGVISKRR